MVRLKDRKNYLLFASSDAFKRFLTRKISPTVNEGVLECCVMERFPGNRILFTAEHAQTVRIPLKDETSSKKVYAGLGDKNTGVLAKIGAYYLRSAYMIPLFVRTDADASRPPEDLGRGLRLFVKPRHGQQKTVAIQIHKKSDMLQHLNKYHSTIEALDPNVIVSIHGISVKRKFDLLFGFGEDYEFIGGKIQAFKFKNEFTNYLDQIFREIGIHHALNIGVSTWRFTGSQNYVLTKHIAERNQRLEEGKKKRIGLQVELNFRGRVSEDDENIPTIPYQIVVQALGDFVYKWKNGNNGKNF